ncbi:hypothetical protein BU14_0103s0026 [Porphyra umbilicalis]|uniref:Uncharacterized protein n=1 Tax=Porphyra umbilicalis TaxID=2786 RepID=A0A1X6PDG8_PORUM|nr:hypothetical protein BU14_0103s0026 [Porphyra umbilicalis]|eukprot:OSX78683.1 hypothetical protein BU14_0103s0026 [Porphyra umbilicalis]
MAFRARAYDYLALLGGDGGTAGADAAAEVWIREGREDLDTWRSLTRLDPAMLNAILFPRADNDEAALSSNASHNGQAPSGT